MKKTFIFGLLASAFLMACESTPKSDEAEVGDAKEVNEEEVAAAKEMPIDTDLSMVTWVGTKPVGKHQGTFKVSEGAIAVEEGKIVGGNFVIDVTSIEVTDEEMGDEEKAKLAGHLSSPDFFTIEEFPTATFEIVSVADYVAPEGEEEKDPEYTLVDPTHSVTGNLELKGVKKSITFPAKIVMADNKVDAQAKFNINRKDWGMDYGADESLGDKFINPTVHIGFDIKTKE